jgi:hypothetical protein
MLDARPKPPPGWRPSPAAVSAMAALLRRLAAREAEKARAAPREAAGRAAEVTKKNSQPAPRPRAPATSVP